MTRNLTREHRVFSRLLGRLSWRLTRRPSAHLTGGSRPRALIVTLVGAMLLGALGCATVRPEERAVLADPVMRFDGNAREEAARQHVFENREGSFGGGSVEGGGCGCN